MCKIGLLACSANTSSIDVCLQVEHKPAVSIGWQLFDPESGRFLSEGEWTTLPATTTAGEPVPIDVKVSFPPGPGDYRVYVSAIDPERGWLYTRGERFLIIDAVAGADSVKVLKTEMTTRSALLVRSLLRSMPKIFTRPITTVLRNRALIRSMVRRDITARYRGSFGDLFWTVLNPLLLMLTYYFVFGVVLRTRFGADQSSGSFLLYFLAGMLPWLAFSEPVGRSPNSILEHRTFVKKLVFPLDTLSVNHVMAGLVTELFALVVFLVFLLALRGHVPGTVAWLPVLIVPQLLFTLGLCWFLAALGVFVRDLAQVMGFILTLWFFITPICYPEQSVPPSLLGILSKNPMFALVRDYRAIFLDSKAPSVRSVAALWIVSLVVFYFGHAWFYKLRKTFADVI